MARGTQTDLAPLSRSDVTVARAGSTREASTGRPVDRDDVSRQDPVSEALR